MSKKIIFINSHPIQYFAPLYAFLTKANMDIEVLYCSDETIKGAMDKEFGVPILWDVPLLIGYNSIFLKNNAFNKGIHNGFWGLMNIGIWKALRTKEKKIVIVPGWQFFSFVLAIFAAKIYGHKVCIRAETPLSHKLLNHGILQTLKNGMLKLLFRNMIDHFLYIGQENKAYYKSFGITDEQLIFTPYSVDNDRFQKDFKELVPQTEKIKKELQLPENKFIILFSGKFIEKKRPLDLLKAIQLSPHKNSFAVVFMGEGELRREMEVYIEKNQLKNCILTGFVNQSAVKKYYATSDVFVMCSGVGETWGLSTNEAMNFGLPIILSHLTGSSADFVKTSSNGYVFNTGDINALSKCLDDSYLKYKKNPKIKCQSSLTIVKEYSFETIANNLHQLYK